MVSHPQNPVKATKMFLLFIFFFNNISRRKKWRKKKKKASSVVFEEFNFACYLKWVRNLVGLPNTNP